MLIKMGLLLTSIIVSVGCTSTAVTPSPLNPKGPAAGRIAGLWWLMMVLGGVTFLLVIGMLGWALWRNRPVEANDQSENFIKDSRRFIIGAGVLFPAVVLLIVFGSTMNTLADLNGLEEDDHLLIEVVGHQWWWQVNYPQQRFSTANEIHIPVGEPVEFKLNSADVIHSFWVPELHGKLDLVPGHTNTLWLEANEPGQYWGLCAEFCGLQHAKMLFVVVAEPRDAFEEWLTDQQAGAAIPEDALSRQGQGIFMARGCADCHTVRGTQAVGNLGPDLTHFADRLTLGAGIAPNTRENLARWIVAPHSMKAGNLMPATSLSEDELSALLAYLESLN